MKQDSGKQKLPQARHAAATMHGQAIQGKPFFKALAYAALDSLLILSGAYLTLLAGSNLLPLPDCARPAFFIEGAMADQECFYSVASFSLIALVLLCIVVCSFVSTYFCSGNRLQHSSLVATISLITIALYGLQTALPIGILALLVLLCFLALFSGYRSFYLLRRVVR